MIKTTSYDQHEIIRNIIALHITDGQIWLDPTYSKGKFYDHPMINQPRIKSDLYPMDSSIEKADAASLPAIDSGVIRSIMFDPPFLAGYTKQKPTGIIGERFHGFRYMADVWEWYDRCLVEFHRVLKDKGVLIFKCQDTVSSGKQWWSHIHIINEAEKLGFYCKDIFILNAKNRIIGHNHSNQKHARKFHSYFLVLEKKK
jgi:tRNA G10  N-methylase Trm11